MKFTSVGILIAYMTTVYGESTLHWGKKLRSSNLKEEEETNWLMNADAACFGIRKEKFKNCVITQGIPVSGPSDDCSELKISTDCFVNNCDNSVKGTSGQCVWSPKMQKAMVECSYENPCN